MMRESKLAWAGSVFATLILVGLAATSAAAQPVGLLVTPDTGTLGTVVTVTGEGFGDKRGAVDLRTPGIKKRYRLKVLAWSDTAVTAEVKRAKLGTYTVAVRPKGKLLPDQSLEAGFTLSPFVLQQITPAAVVSGMEVVLRGPYLGKKKGRIKVGIWRAKPTRWDPVLEDPGDGGPPIGEVAFLMPKRLEHGLFDVEIRTPAGTTFLELVLEALDAGSGQYMKPILWGRIDGKRFVARHPRALLQSFPLSNCQELGIDVNQCYAGVGIKTAKRGIVMIFIDWNPGFGPTAFTDKNAFFAYLDGGNRVYLGPGSMIEVLTTFSNDKASGRFEGTIFLEQGKGPEQREVTRGRFYL
jgi:hypothetical protein